MALIVRDAGLFTTVHDGGRPGHREWGVPAGGSFDRGSAELANALVGNPSTCAVLELTLLGGTYQAACPLALALAGAPMEAKVARAGSHELVIGPPASFALGPGDRLLLGRAVVGARTYLAVKGGWQTPLHLGSRSSEKRLPAGAILPAAAGTIPVRRSGEPVWKSPAADPIRMIAGPDGRCNRELDAAFWAGRRFQVGSQINRMGLRLHGDPVTTVSPPDRLSAPVAPGAIQCAGGQLIVLGVSCGTMGGYPHIGHVISADLDRLGQLRPGDAITFHQVTLEEARSIDRSQRTARRALLRRVATLVEDD